MQNSLLQQLNLLQVSEDSKKRNDPNLGKNTIKLIGMLISDEIKYFSNYQKGTRRKWASDPKKENLTKNSRKR